MDNLLVPQKLNIPDKKNTLPVLYKLQQDTLRLSRANIQCAKIQMETKYGKL